MLSLITIFGQIFDNLLMTAYEITYGEIADDCRVEAAIVSKSPTGKKKKGVRRKMDRELTKVGYSLFHIPRRIFIEAGDSMFEP